MAAGHFGRISVLSTMRKQPGRVSATLHRRTAGDSFDDYAYADAYLHPVHGATGLSGDGFPSQTTTAVLYQHGETVVPRADDRITISGNTWLVVAVASRLAKDTGYGVHDCTVNDAL